MMHIVLEYLKVSCRDGESWGVMVMNRENNTVTGAQEVSGLPSSKSRPNGCYQLCSGQVFLLSSMNHMPVISEMTFTDRLWFCRHLSVKMLTDLAIVLLLWRHTIIKATIIYLFSIHFRFQSQFFPPLLLPASHHFPHSTPLFDTSQKIRPSMWSQQSLTH